MYYVESPAIRTVSNGSSIYSVMYAGSGNKITIKRKAAAVDDTEVGPQDMDGNPHSSVGGVKCIPSSHLKYGTPSQKKSSKGSKVISIDFRLILCLTERLYYNFYLNAKRYASSLILFVRCNHIYGFA